MTPPPLANIAAHLPAMAARFPDAVAVAFPRGGGRYEQWSFERLNQESDALARGLKEQGVGAGVRTVLMVKPSLSFFAMAFALFKAGAVPVMVDPGMGVKNLGRCLSEAQPQAFVGIPTAHLARIALGWARKTLQTKIWVSDVSLEKLKRCGGSIDLFTTRCEDVAAILFTSGSTGAPKGVVYTHGNFNAQVAALREVYGIEPGEVDLCTFPLFALYAPALGMTAIVPRMDFTRPGRVDPREIIDPIQRFNVTNLFGSPALIRRVGQAMGGTGLRLPSLRRVISAGAPVPATVIERFAALLRHDVQLFTPYGATEALPVCSIGSHEILEETRALTDAGHGVCVGRPAPGIALKIIRITDDPITQWRDELELPRGRIGEITVKGPQVTRLYYNRPQSTEQAKITDPLGGFWHRMGDVGYVDEQGRVWFCGRKSHRVTTENGVMFTIPCEAVFNTHPAVFRSALVGIGEPGRRRPVLCVELEPAAGRVNHAALRRELLELGASHPHTATIGDILFSGAFPVDIRHNAKIGREELGRWAARRLR